MEQKSTNEIAEIIYQIYNDIETSNNINSITNKDQIIKQIFYGPKIGIGNISFNCTEDSFIVETYYDEQYQYEIYQPIVNVYSISDRNRIYRLFKNKIIRKNRKE